MTVSHLKVSEFQLQNRGEEHGSRYLALPTNHDLHGCMRLGKSLLLLTLGILLCEVGMTVLPQGLWGLDNIHKV